MEVEILYEDAELIVVVKPPGMPSQSERSMAVDMVSYLKNYLAKPGGREPYVAVIHRLDRPVGGVMVYAKSRNAASALSAQISKGQMSKRYMAVLNHTLKNKQGRLENELLKDKQTNLSKIVPAGTPGAKHAVLDYKVIRTKYIDGKQYSLAEVDLVTGRHHQIRIQMAGAGAGIYGDTKYNPDFNSVKTWTDIGLFAWHLEFTHPKTRKKMVFEKRPDHSPFTFFA